MIAFSRSVSLWQTCSTMSFSFWGECGCACGVIHHDLRLQMLHHLRKCAKHPHTNTHPNKSSHTIIPVLLPSRIDTHLLFGWQLGIFQVQKRATTTTCKTWHILAREIPTCNLAKIVHIKSRAPRERREILAFFGHHFYKIAHHEMQGITPSNYSSGCNTPSACTRGSQLLSPSTSC